MASRASLDGSRGFSSAGKDVSDRRTGGALRGEGAALLQHGQKLYQQGKFKAATEAFTEVFLVLVCICDNMEAASGGNCMLHKSKDVFWDRIVWIANAQSDRANSEQRRPTKVDR
jgi:hypothetical protein